MFMIIVIVLRAIDFFSSSIIRRRRTSPLGLAHVYPGLCRWFSSASLAIHKAVREAVTLRRLLNESKISQMKS